MSNGGSKRKATGPETTSKKIKTTHGKADFVTLTKKPNKIIEDEEIDDVETESDDEEESDEGVEDTEDIVKNKEKQEKSKIHVPIKIEEKEGAEASEDKKETVLFLKFKQNQDTLKENLEKIFTEKFKDYDFNKLDIKCKLEGRALLYFPNDEAANKTLKNFTNEFPIEKFSCFLRKTGTREVRGGRGGRGRTGVRGRRGGRGGSRGRTNQGRGGRTNQDEDSHGHSGGEKNQDEDSPKPSKGGSNQDEDSPESSKEDTPTKSRSDEPIKVEPTPKSDSGSSSPRGGRSPRGRGGRKYQGEDSSGRGSRGSSPNRGGRRGGSPSRGRGKRRSR